MRTTRIPRIPREWRQMLREYRADGWNLFMPDAFEILPTIKIAAGASVRILGKLSYEMSYVAAEYVVCK